jgi:hypothetical protein
MEKERRGEGKRGAGIEEIAAREGEGEGPLARAQRPSLHCHHPHITHGHPTRI